MLTKENPGAAGAATGAKATNQSDALDTSRIAPRQAPCAVRARIKRKTRPLSPIQARELRRLNELRALADDRARRGEPFGDLARWALLLAACLLFHAKGCDYYSFRETLRRVPGLNKALDEETVMDAIHEVERIMKWRGPAYLPIKARTAGTWLGLTTAERRRCGITTIAAVDETPAETKERQRDEKREQWQRKADKAVEAKRGRRRRAAKGAKPHAESHSRTKPWAMHGMSRRTWYRKGWHKSVHPDTPARGTKTSETPILTDWSVSDEFVPSSKKARPHQEDTGSSATGEFATPRHGREERIREGS
jgi:hypothetical protein